MSVQINLLPDLRQTKLKERARRRLAGVIMSVVVAGCAAVIVLGVGITQAQNLQIRNLTNQIKTDQAQLSATPNIQDMLTVQRNMNSLSMLYGQKVQLSKFFKLLSNIDPKDVVVNHVILDSTNTLDAQGQAKTFTSASKLAQAMMASGVTLGSNASASATPDFTNVTLSNLSADSVGHITFDIKANMSPGVTSGH